MNAFTIKDLENLSGIKAHTIRIWEQRYKFLRPQRTPTNIRYYSNEELRIILNIALLNKYGFKISHIDRMQPQEIQERILSLGDPMAVQERVIIELVQHMVELEIEEFERVLSKYISVKGIEKTVLQIIFPFLEKIGILWQTGHINPSQEHLVTNIIRNKLILAIESTNSSVRIDKKFLLFLPEGEHHELGLLFMNYLLKSRGASVIYLGADCPVKDVEHVIRIKQPELVFVHLTATCPNFNFDRFLTQIGNNLPQFKTIISGVMTHGYRKPIPENIEFKTSLGEIMELVGSL
jgi:DNA-binding transcriptional MerR regulator